MNAFLAAISNLDVTVTSVDGLRITYTIGNPDHFRALDMQEAAEASGLYVVSEGIEEDSKLGFWLEMAEIQRVVCVSEKWIGKATGEEATFQSPRQFAAYCNGQFGEAPDLVENATGVWCDRNNNYERILVAE